MRSTSGSFLYILYYCIDNYQRANTLSLKSLKIQSTYIISRDSCGLLLTFLRSPLVLQGKLGL